MASLETRVLVVHDAQKPCRLVAALEGSGFRTETTRIADDLPQTLRACSPAVILFDVTRSLESLPVCGLISRTSESPLVVLATGDNEADRLLGFELGAADYICKPFSPREVIARTRAILRRTQPAKRIAPTGLSLDVERYTAVLDAHPLDLTPTEFRLLALLAAEPNRAFERTHLARRLYHEHRQVGSRAVDSLVRNLRRKLAKVRPGRQSIKTVYGTGYSLHL